MKIHPREKIVDKAECALRDAVAGLVEKYELTYGELHRVINSVQSNWIKYQIRDERDTDGTGKPGGLA